MRILALDTATDACSAAILNDGQVAIAKGEPLHRIIRAGSEHARQLPLMVEELLTKLQNTDPTSSIDAIAISEGPGSYTGLRIGTSVAKGIAYGISAPLYAVPTLLSMAEQVAQTTTPLPWVRGAGQRPEGYEAAGLRGTSPLLAPMIDARRMEVYTALYDAQLRELAPVSAQVIDADSFASLLAEHKVCFFGNGAPKCSTVIVHENAVFIENIVPDAAWVGKTLFRLLASPNPPQPVSTAYWTPFYLKEYEAKKSTNKIIS